MSYLIDTNIISETAPGRVAAPALLQWLGENDASIYLSVITIAEIEAGIAKAARQSATRKARVFQIWLNGIVRDYGARIYPIDLDIARLSGRIRDRALGTGHDPGTNDVFIAATAAHHGLTVLTRNLRHFAPLGVRAIDPVLAPPA